MATASSPAAVAAPVLDRLRPHPHGGEIIAAGAVPLALAAFVISGSGSLVGWPLFLFVIEAAGLVIGVRPRRPLPPPPQESSATTSETVPLWSDKD